MKTSELIGPALDWAVATCEKNWAFEPDGCDSYSTDWALGGPIIEREMIQITPRGETTDLWEAEINANDYHNRKNGPTPLIAAMRCYVYSHLGYEVRIPSELIKGF